MSTKQTDIVKDLEQSGLRNTKCRAVVLDILKKSERPITAETVYRYAKEKNIPVSFSTIYRALGALADKSLITKLNITGENRAFYEYNRTGHCHYLICLGCKKIHAIEYCPLKDYEESLQKQTAYAISGHKLVIYGYCPACQKNE